ncbi:YciI family protein [Sphingomonas donggukensis]|uniref:YciI family protein n=1 Tax=Sphingomonas donggukensis TaxID=2949093 RepID=A0ABY4TSK9_9SPHN|nr:YciI family protein [Sphingomonas donggukensis]URW74800.1 YciI family protein [Sphingomonas donggukensis]
MARVNAAPVSIVTLTYVAPLDAVDAQMAAHVAWLERGVAEGVLLIAGRQVPRVGGVLIFRGRRAEVEALAATDPFVTSGVATAAVVEIAASFAAEAVAATIA